jgi:indolepyruvate ferredoxin oxidoreductase beta subunit
VQAPNRLAEKAPVVPLPVGGSARERAELDRALHRIATEFPAAAQVMLGIGVRRVVDYQDVAYAHEYLDYVAVLRDLDSTDGRALTVEAAKQIAVAMSYDDVIRVADLKTRSRRFARVRNEVVAKQDQIVETTEFMHPRVAEMCGTMPVGLGRFVENSKLWSGLLRRLFEHGRRVRTTHMRGFLPLYAVAGLRRWRRSLLRHGREIAHLEAWLTVVKRYAPTDPALAIEVLKCRRLVKGYSDTHSRGEAKFDKVIGAVSLLDGRTDAADWVRRLRDAALADADGKLLDGAIATVRSL